MMGKRILVATLLIVGVAAGIAILVQVLRRGEADMGF